MLTRTTAICLRCIDVSKTSRRVVWLSADYGRLATIIKGAMRPKSYFLGQFDLFYTCELVFQTIAQRTVHPARSCTPLALRPRLRSDWRACATASYWCDLVGRLAPDEHRDPSLYELLEYGLDELQLRGGTAVRLLGFEVDLLNNLGFAPRLHHCLECQRQILPRLPSPFFEPARGGLLCARCRKKRTGRGLAAAPDLLAALQYLGHNGGLKGAQRLKLSSRQARELSTLLGMFMEYHLNLRPASRGFAVEALFARPERI